MSIDYHLTLAASISPTSMLERISPSLPKPFPSPTADPGSLFLDLSEQLGFDLMLSVPSENKYVGGSTDDGEWSWDLPIASSLSFGYYKFYEGSATAAENVLKVVAQVLTTGDEDLAFTLEYDKLYLLRQDGTVTKYFRETFWNHYPSTDELIPG